MRERSGANEKSSYTRLFPPPRLSQVQSKLFAKSEECRLLELKLDGLTEQQETDRKRLEELTEKLRAARDSESKVEENYRQELVAQTNLAQHYKGKFM